MKNNIKCWCKSGKLYEDCHKNFDIKLDELKKQGKIVPPQRLIKNEKQIAEIIKKTLDELLDGFYK